VATPGELCNKTAELLGLQPNTTLIAWRALREDQRVTTGGRGKSAAHCTPSDAASLLIATIGKMPLQSYLQSWERFSGLTCTRLQQRRGRSVEELGGFNAGHSFQEGLTALIASATSGSLQGAYNPGSIRIGFLGPYPGASIRLVGDIDAWIAYEELTASLPGLQPDGDGDLEQSKHITGKTIFGLGELLRRNGSSK